MPATELSGQSLQWWLEHIGSVHLSEIELGLERVGAVAGRLGLERPAPHVVTVAGTNGKGSVVSCLEQGLRHIGKTFGSYTSPHIEHYNERIRLQGNPVDDALICSAFSSIEEARAEISLSYFEFSTLAALLIFQQNNIEVAVLEVGLGGRLDAVNLVDPDIAVITSIALDHQDWLGSDRESIALEKAGILRHQIPFVCGDPDPPSSLLLKSETLGCSLLRVGHDFQIVVQADGLSDWQFTDNDGQSCVIEQMKLPHVVAENAACALQVFALLNTALDQGLVEQLADCSPPGRQERRIDRQTAHRVLLDVAHNPAACRQLAGRLEELEQAGEISGKLVVVLAVMADKDIQDMACSLASCTDIWYIAQVDVPRCMPAKEAAEQIQKCGAEKPVNLFGSVEEAFRSACENSNEGDLIVVTGSFYTVAAVRAMTESDNSN